VSRVLRSAAMRNVQRCRVTALGLERQAVDQPPTSLAGQHAALVAVLRAYRAWAHAAWVAAASYREGSAAREFAESTSRLLNMAVASKQLELARARAGA
jgi:hypothetical protein